MALRRRSYFGDHREVRAQRHQRIDLAMRRHRTVPRHYAHRKRRCGILGTGIPSFTGQAPGLKAVRRRELARRESVFSSRRRRQASTRLTDRRGTTATTRSNAPAAGASARDHADGRSSANSRSCSPTSRKPGLERYRVLSSGLDWTWLPRPRSLPLFQGKGRSRQIRCDTACIGVGRQEALGDNRCRTLVKTNPLKHRRS